MADGLHGWTCVCTDGPCSEFPCKSHGVADAPERDREYVRQALADNLYDVEDWIVRLYERIAALEQERNVAVEAYNNVWDCNETLRTELAQLREAIREIERLIDEDDDGVVSVSALRGAISVRCNCGTRPARRGGVHEDWCARLTEGKNDGRD